MGLRKKTEVLRATVSQEIREIIGIDSENTGYREITLMTPLSPTIFMSMTDNADIAAGLNRTYKLVPLAQSSTIVIPIAPDQKIYCAADSGQATLGVVIAYWE